LESAEMAENAEKERHCGRRRDAKPLKRLREIITKLVQRFQAWKELLGLRVGDASLSLITR
jgi:hypothetical protein